MYNVKPSENDSQWKSSRVLTKTIVINPEITDGNGIQCRSLSFLTRLITQIATETA